MPVIKEFQCLNCGTIFDSDIPSCISCGTTNVERVFHTPFAMKSDKTKFNDHNIQALCKEYKLGDYTNNLSRKHDPPTSKHWSSIEDVDTNDLAIAREGSAADIVKNLKGNAAGKFTAMVHKEDAA